MREVPVVTARAEAALIPDGATVTVSSSSGLGCPDAVLEAIGQRYRRDRRSGKPDHACTRLPPATCTASRASTICAGRVSCAGCSPAPTRPAARQLDPPLIRQLIHNDQIQALNIPSGVLFQMHRAASTGQPGVLTEVGLGTYADPRLEGAKMNAVTEDFVQLMQVDGNDYLFYPAVHVDVAIIRATTADPHGNLSYEEECSTLGALDQAYAAHNNGGIVIAQVKRLLRHPAADPGRPRTRDPRRRDRGRPRPDADHPDRLRPGAIRRGAPRPRRHRAGRVRPGEGDRPPGGGRTAGRRIVNLGFGISAASPAGAAGGGPRRRCHLGDRAGRGRRLPGDRVRVRVRTEPAGAVAKRRPVHPAAGRRLRRGDAVVPGGGRRGDVNVSYLPGRATSPPALAASTTSSPGARHRFLRLLHRRQGTSRSTTASSTSPTARSPSSSPRLPQISFSGGGPSSTARRSSTSPNAASSSCPEGLTVIEIAPGRRP